MQICEIGSNSRTEAGADYQLIVLFHTKEISTPELSTVYIYKKIK